MSTEDQRSNRNYQNWKYREWAKSAGLAVDALGHTSETPSASPFWDVLQKYSVEMATVMQS